MCCDFVHRDRYLDQYQTDKFEDEGKDVDRIQIITEYDLVQGGLHPQSSFPH
jgi:hypothetical protein